MLISLDFTTLVADIIERLIGSDGSPYEKRVDAKGRVTSDKCIANEVPFGIPESWVWARFSEVIEIAARLVDPLKYQDFPHIAPDNIQKGTGKLLFCHSVKADEVKSANHLFSAGQILYSKIRPALRKAVIAPFDGLCSADMYPLNTKLRPEYILTVLLSNFFTEETLKGDTRVKMPKTNQKSLNVILIPIPPLAEQRRIVDRVNELMPLVEEYGGLEDAREALDAALPGRLRKSVLQLAVQGGLAPQDPADEPAGVLLERIRGQRRQLVAEGKVKAPKGGESIIFAGSDGRRYEKRVDARGRESDPVCIEDEIPFEIPEGWEWARLESICELVRGSGIKRSDIAVEGLPCVRYGELYTTYETSITTVASYTSEAVFNVSKKIEPGEVLITLTGENNIDIGRAVFNATEDTLAFGGDLLALKGQNIRGDYLVAAINSSAVGSQRTRASTGNIIVHLSAAKACRFLIPVPPLQEQGRIVELINEFVALVTS